MPDSKDRLLKFLERTTVLVTIDRRLRVLNSDLTDDEKVIANVEDLPYSSLVEFDNHISFEESFKSLDNPFEEFKEYIDDKIDDKVYHKELFIFLRKIRATLIPIYQDFDIQSLKGPLFYLNLPIASKFVLKPNIEIVLKNGFIYEICSEDLSGPVSAYIEKKLNLFNRLIPLVDYYLDIIKSQPKSQKSRSLKFRDIKLETSPRLKNFHKSLLEHNLIEKIDHRFFANCFSGKDVETKINWIESEASLIYLMKQLVFKEFIKEEGKWLALSNSFLRKSKTILPDKIMHTTAPCAQKIRAKVDECIDQLMLKP
jgi:hypothetical protein